MILGIGNILFSDEGFGVRVVQRLDAEYTFPENVTLLDGGVAGLNLLGYVTDADRMIVVDAIKNRGDIGDFYRLNYEDLPQRIRSKNSLHQVDFLETLTMCQVLDKVPQTVILGVEPEDIETLGVTLTPVIEVKVDAMIALVLKELDQLGVTYQKGAAPHVPCDPLQDC